MQIRCLPFKNLLFDLLKRVQIKSEEYKLIISFKNENYTVKFNWKSELFDVVQKEKANYFTF